MMDDQQLSDLMHTYYKPWRDVINVLHKHGLPYSATHQQTLEWLHNRMELAQQVMAALEEYRALEARVTALEANNEREFGK